MIADVVIITKSVGVVTIAAILISPVNKKIIVMVVVAISTIAINMTIPITIPIGRVIVDGRPSQQILFNPHFNDLKWMNWILT